MPLSAGRAVASRGATWCAEQIFSATGQHDALGNSDWYERVRRELVDAALAAGDDLDARNGVFLAQFGIDVAVVLTGGGERCPRLRNKVRELIATYFDIADPREPVEDNLRRDYVVAQIRNAGGRLQSLVRRAEFSPGSDAVIIDCVADGVVDDPSEVLPDCAERYHEERVLIHST